MLMGIFGILAGIASVFLLEGDATAAVILIPLGIGYIVEEGKEESQ